MKLIKTVKMPEKHREEHEWGWPSVLDEFFSDSFLVSPLHGRSEWMPAIDVTETDQDVNVTTELPGMEEKDIKIELHNGILTISGEKTQESEEKKENVYRKERRFGSFSRSVTIGENINENGVKANFKNGILKVTLPKTEKAKPKLIRIG